MRKIYIVPNLVTSANLFCGFFAITESIQFEYVSASWAILAAAIFDALDGRVARLAKATSKFGVEYDSLSDLVSFGIAPGILLYQWAFAPYGRLGVVAAFFFATCGALRLARFNVTTESVPKGFFQGLPIPGAATAVATLVIAHDAFGAFELPHLGVVAWSVFLSLLMVSSLRFPSFKELNWKSRATFAYLMLGVSVMVMMAVRPDLTLFVVISAYILGTFLWNAFRLLVPGPAGVVGKRSDAQSKS